MPYIEWSLKLKLEIASFFSVQEKNKVKDMIIINWSSSDFFIKQTYKKLFEIQKKKVVVAGLEPTFYLHDYSKLSN